MKATLDITILLPVYNEKDNLEPLIDEIQTALQNLNQTYEILCVDDGSTDGSLDLLRALDSAVPQVRVVEFDKNYGQSAAFGAGFKEARGNVLITMDSDGQNDPADIPALLEAMAASHVGAVCGYRKERNDSWVKKASSKIANSVRNKISQDQIRDTGCSLKAFRRETLQDFFYFKGMHRFLPTLVRMAGFEVTEVPVNHRARTKGVSKYSTRNRLIQPFLDLLAVKWMKDKKLRYQIRTRKEENV